MQKTHFFTALLLFIFFSVSSHAVPLSTKSRWIINDATGKRIKLVCANWEGHTQPMLPEGLNKQRLDDISRRISLMGFNCIRLTYATDMFIHHAELTVTQNFKNLKLNSAIEGISKYNPDLLALTLVDAQKAVIESLISHGIMVVLDCQVSRPMWCCGDNDGNGFFGDKYFNPQEWLRTLSIVAERYRDTPMVVGMSLRNEIRGPNQTQPAWYYYVEKGAKTIHKYNPHVLVLISGLYYDLDFSYLKEKPLDLKLGKKLVYETHRYSFTEGQQKWWVNENANYVCEKTTQEIENKVGFLMKGKHAAPLFITEFGVNVYGTNKGDNKFLSCYLIWLAKNDLDWALWALQGSYYLRDNKQDPEETYGIFDAAWTKMKSPVFHHKLQLIHRTLQDPFSKHKKDLILYHPLSGNCGLAYQKHVLAGDCWKPSAWSYRGDGTPIRLKGTNRCLTAFGEGLPVVLTDDCTSENSIWKLARNSPYQLANRDEYGNDLCLDWDASNSDMVLTKKCIVAGRDDPHSVKLQNPQRQWFSLIESNSKASYR